MVRRAHGSMTMPLQIMCFQLFIYCVSFILGFRTHFGILERQVMGSHAVCQRTLSMPVTNKRTMNMRPNQRKARPFQLANLEISLFHNRSGRRLE